MQEEIVLSFSFRVPVLGDGTFGIDIVNHNDTTVFQIAQGFDLQGSAGPFDLVCDGQKVGILNVTGVPATKVLNANIDFDGNPDIFDSTGNNWSDVFINFDCNGQASL